MLFDYVLEGACEVGVLDVHLSGRLTSEGGRGTGEGVAEGDEMGVEQLLAQAEEGLEGGKGAFVKQNYLVDCVCKLAEDN